MGVENVTYRRFREGAASSRAENDLREHAPASREARAKKRSPLYFSTKPAPSAVTRAEGALTLAIASWPEGQAARRGLRSMTLRVFFLGFSTTSAGSVSACANVAGFRISTSGSVVV